MQLTLCLGLGSVLTDVILTDVRFLDVRPVRVCFSKGSKETVTFSCFGRLLDINSALTSEGPFRNTCHQSPKASVTSPKALKRPKKASKGQRRKSVDRKRRRGAFPKVNRNARRFCLLDAFSTLVDIPKASKRRASVKLTSVKTEP